MSVRDSATTGIRPLPLPVSRRSLLGRAAALGLGAAAVYGPSPAVRAAAQDSGEPVSLTIWLNGEPGTTNAVTEILAA